MTSKEANETFEIQMNERIKMSVSLSKSFIEN